MEYVIRFAEPDDVAALPAVERRAVRLFEDWLEETGLTKRVLDDVSTVDELEEARQRGHLWIAKSPRGEVVGFAQLMILDRVAHLDEIDVLPEHGGRGVGSQMLEAVCRWAADAGYPKITLSTFRHVPWNQPFYERRGFRVVAAPRLGPEHQALIKAERARGLRTDLRVIMEYPLREGV